MSDEVSLIPPYLLDTDGAQPEEGGAQRTYGTLSYNRRRDCWVVKGDPGVTELCKAARAAGGAVTTPAPARRAHKEDAAQA